MAEIQVFFSGKAQTFGKVEKSWPDLITLGSNDPKVIIFWQNL